LLFGCLPGIEGVIFVALFDTYPMARGTENILKTSIIMKG